MAIVRAVTGLGRSLGIVTTAEGVENERSSSCSGAKAAPRCRATCSARRGPHPMSRSCWTGRSCALA